MIACCAPIRTSLVSVRRNNVHAKWCDSKSRPSIAGVSGPSLNFSLQCGFYTFFSKIFCNVELHLLHINVMDHQNLKQKTVYLKSLFKKFNEEIFSQNKYVFSALYLNFTLRTYLRLDKSLVDSINTRTTPLALIAIS